MAKTASISYLRSVVSDGRATARVCGEPLLKPNGNQSLAVTVAIRDAEGALCAEVTAEMILLKKRD